MKKVLALLFLLCLASCNDDKDKPAPFPDPAVLAKQQAPFGTSAVDVKLTKLLFNGKLFAEYFYEGDLLREQKKYLLFNVPGHYQTGSFKRNSGKLESYDVESAEWIAESQYVSDVFKPSYSIRFDAPVFDTLRTVTEENLVFLSNYTRTYIFDKQGFVKREVFLERSYGSNDITTTYKRNEQHNVVASTVLYAAQPSVANRIEYEYDSHPNPFFKLGIDRSGQLAAHSLSPNNIVKETIIDAAGPVYFIEYQYEYGANGYPSKVKVESNSLGFIPYTMEFSY